MEEILHIERMSNGADAVAHLQNGKTAFVPQAAPGDVVRVEIIEEKARFARARLLEVLESGSARAKAKWVCRGKGSTDEEGRKAVHALAPWQHLSAEAQAFAKKANVEDVLVHLAHFSFEEAQNAVKDLLPSPKAWAYRNKIELGVFRNSKNKLELGFYEGAMQGCAVLDSYPLAVEAIQDAPSALRGALRYLSGNSELGIFRVALRAAQNCNSLEIALWCRPSAFPRAWAARTLESALPATGIVRVIAQDDKSRKVKGIETLYGSSYWHERLATQDFSVSAPAFFQTNTAAAEVLVACALAQAGKVNGAKVFDLYAGCGTFSLAFARKGACLTAVECSGYAIQNLRSNARKNACEIQVIAGDSARELARLGGCDVVLVDPPRSGLSSSLPALLSASSPHKLIYVSCNLATWARDVVRLGSCGFALKEVQPIDMFPQTPHVELCSVFEPA